ncbi:MAG: peptidylprolyl isomerase [Aureispira sp.]
MSVKSLTSFILLLLIVVSCKKDAVTVQGAIDVDLEDAVIQQIFNFQNKRDTKALLSYLTVENPTHRYLAAMAFGSVQDTAAIDNLVDLLKDDYEQVRAAAAFALGQTRNQAASAPLAEAFGQDSSRLVQASILEAIGRCGTLEHLKYMSVARPYPIQDSILLEGQAAAIYRFALRGLVHKEGTTKIMNDFMANSLISSEARFMAAQYLARTKNLDLSGYGNVLINNVTEETDPNTRMALVKALAKSKAPRALATLKNQYQKEVDYRVRCNLIRGLQHFAYDSVKTLVFSALQDSNLQVRLVAAEYLQFNGTDLDAGKYYERGLNHSDWQVRATLLGAALRNLSYFKTKTKGFFSSKIIGLYKKSDNLYEKSVLLQQLGNYSWNYRFLAGEIFPAADSIKIPEVIRSSGMLGLVNLRDADNYNKELGLSRTRVTTEINALLQRAITEGDPAMQAIGADFLTSEKHNFKEVFSEVAFLKTAQGRLSLPSNLETYLSLQRAIDYLQGSEKTPPKRSNSFTEIDWPLIRVLKDKPNITMQTSKGSVVLELHPHWAPATVTQFVQLAKAKYYDNKLFHRVVPNFVAQGGCSRGDGWSSFNITIASEFHQNANYHEEGWIGMASAGKDTESAQFFITHSATPHLDGNYTIFAKVVKGMDVVHDLQLGDRIISVDIN